MTEMIESEQKIDATFIRDEKIFNLTLLGWSKTRIASELGISRTVVSMVVNSDYGQKRLAEMYETVDQAMVRLPELVGIATHQLKNVLEGNYHSEKSKTIIEASKLVFGIAAKFKELDRDIKTVTPLRD